jgi:sortase A
MQVPTPSPQEPTRITIPSIGVDAAVVRGDSWEDLKKGAGHHITSANPGERGNMIISAHNDVFGEIFRRLEDVELEDKITVHTRSQSFEYKVKAKRVVEPSDVSVMGTTSQPALTLITCYPYLIDTHRLIVIAELQR